MMNGLVQSEARWGQGKSFDSSTAKSYVAALEMGDWWFYNFMIVSWIFNTIKPKLGSTITYIENAQELSEDIKHKFSI